MADDRDRDTQTCNHVIGPLRDIIAEYLGQRRRSVAGESRPVAMAAGCVRHAAFRTPASLCGSTAKVMACFGGTSAFIFIFFAHFVAMRHDYQSSIC